METARINYLLWLYVQQKHDYEIGEDGTEVFTVLFKSYVLDLLKAFDI